MTLAVVQNRPLDTMCESCGKVRVDHEVVFPDGQVFAVCAACIPGSVIPLPRTPL
jgi:uncharacterized Zn finger protein